VGRLLRIASEARVAGRVRFIGQVSHKNVPALMRSADLAVFVPWYEPFGMAVLEAMACGLPVVASAVGGQRETVVDGVTGTLVRPREPRAVATAVNTLLDNPDLRTAYGTAGAERARASYNWPRIAAQTCAVYEEVMVARGRVPVRRKAS
jgi:glycosyltransferase involved in cell wall biosynthesis